MKITLEKKTFIHAVHRVSRFAEKRSTPLAVLSSVLFVVSDEGIKLRATNLEIGIDAKIPGTKTEEGVVALPAHLLQQLATSLSLEGVVTLEQKGDTLTLTSDSGKSVIKTVPYDDFPSIPFPEQPKNKIVISGILLKNLFLTIGSCASSSTVRPELASIFLSIEGGVLMAVATDSFRLAEKKIPLPTKGTQGKLLIPAKNALEIAQALPDEEIIISFDEHQCAFVSAEGMIVSRLTNAVYPDYHQIVPKESVVEALILRKDFEQALKRTTIFSDSFQKIRMGFDAKKNTLILSARNTDIGESADTIEGKVLGESLELAFNHRYLSTILSLTPAEHLSCTASGAGRPLIIRGVGDTSLLYLVSPMNH